VGRTVVAPTLVFDGDCAMCSSVARWAEARLGDRARVEASQRLGEAGLARLGLTPNDAAAAAWWVDPAAGVSARGHRAVGESLRSIGGMWGVLGRLCLVPPTSWAAALGYGVIVRLRHRLPGGSPACRAPAR
jgi:predicted DCC family thiol-disulfide oxidoreductase YuxK